MVAKDFFEVLISYEFFSMTVLKVARKSIGERVNVIFLYITFLLELVQSVLGVFFLLVHNVMDTVMGGASSITINYVSYRFLIEIKNLI